MVWAWDRLLLVLGIAHLSLCAPSYGDRSSTLPLITSEGILQQDDNEIRRSSLPDKNYNRIDAVSENQEDEPRKAILSTPILYQMHDDLSPNADSVIQRFRPKDPLVDEEALFDQSWRPEDANLFSFGHLQDEDTSGENVSEEEDSPYVASLRSLNAQQLDKDLQEPIWLSKRRLQMKGPGLFGKSLNRKMLGQKSLTGYRGTKNKGLVLSIDLGIKALRDAILHAKVAQKNRKLQAQAQKNMRLLHNIGKRRALISP